VSEARERLAAIVGERLKVDEPLAAYTTMRVGGPADLLALAQTTSEVVALVGAARDLGLPWRIIGRGSNLLIADAGVRGLVIRNTAARVQVKGDGTVARAEAGLSCAQLAGRTAKLGLAGAEFLVAIPGTVGGAVVQNAGAHGTETVDVLARVEYMGPDGRVGSFTPAELGARYRWSRFKEPPRDKAVLVAEVRLARSSPTAVAAKIAEIRTWRANSQPGEPSAGSIFTNPPGDYAGRLIEAAGLKGLRIGGAQISPVHANFIVNLGGASAADVAALIERARATVAEKFGVELEPEVERIGDW
jgi:UDP-N-acetylmuramate dehydrogenase